MSGLPQSPPSTQVARWCVERGFPLPIGAWFTRGGVNFSVFSKNATRVWLRVFEPGGDQPILEMQFDPKIHRTGDLWHVFVSGLTPPIEYVYRMDMENNPNPDVHRFDPSIDLLDPYAREITGDRWWGVRPDGPTRHRRSALFDESFDWEDDQPLLTPLADSVIYEMHVRGMTKHPSSGSAFPGTFRGLIDKIPYLKELGVTAVELLPVAEFEEVDTDRSNPSTGQRLLNFWGYQPISFFAVNATYAADRSLGGPVREFKEMVRAFHQAGIEVILDVVFNHTAEGDARGPTRSFRGLDNSVYYMIDHDSGAYLNYSGCGNTVNCNHPVVRDFIADSLRYWVTEMHVDGFRFDLASILGRGQDGSVLAQPPLLERLAHDPVLADTKLIAEAWDAAGLYQVGTFPAWGRWAEWNGRFRDDIRHFVKSNPNMISLLATRLSGSADLYKGSEREPYHSINFITCHDGFTLNDLVSYNEKHNQANGENNADGANDNISWNCGAEGPTGDPVVNALRARQMRNFASALLLSRGVPMILSGDEFARTQQGNNNAYCQDNDISWLDWSLAEKNKDLLRFFRLLIGFRRAEPLLRFASYTGRGQYEQTGIEWHGRQLGKPDWSSESRSIAMHIYGSTRTRRDHIYMIFHSSWHPEDFEIPRLDGLDWRLKIDTALPSPRDIREPGRETRLRSPRLYRVQDRSVVVLKGFSKSPD
jgi:glycogen operon protein